MVLQLIPRPPGSIWRDGDGIWKAKGGIWRKEQISDNFDSKPENYLWVFEVGSGIKRENQKLKPWYFPSWNENLIFLKPGPNINLLDSILQERTVLVTQSLLIHSFMRLPSYKPIPEVSWSRLLTRDPTIPHCSLLVQVVMHVVAQSASIWHFSYKNKWKSSIIS